MRYAQNVVTGFFVMVTTHKKRQSVMESQQKLRKERAERAIKRLPKQEQLIINELLYFAEIGSVYRVSWESLPEIFKFSKKRYKLENNIVWRKK
jgi:delta-aminolevulinic acid dehydratase/porphobilinogen synthase